MFRPAVLELIHLQYGGSVRACHTAGARPRTFFDPCRGSHPPPYSTWLAVGRGLICFPRPSALHED
jgi:hypothetical protein